MLCCVMLYYIISHDIWILQLIIWLFYSIIYKLNEGDVIALRPGEECPADGVVVRGKASCSEAAITGEARPVEKRKEHEMLSGCVILNGYVELKVSRDYANSTLSVIEAKVEDAQMQRTKRQLLLERFARIWTPLVLLTVLLTCTVVPLATQDDVHRWIHRGLGDPSYCLSVRHCHWRTTGHHLCHCGLCGQGSFDEKAGHGGAAANDPSGGPRQDGHAVEGRVCRASSGGISRGAGH